MRMVSGDGAPGQRIVSKISRIRSFDFWEELLVGGGKLWIFEMRPLIDVNWAFDLRGSKSTEDPQGWDC